MGDRRKGDRRSREEGVLKVDTKKAWIFGTVILAFIASIVLNVVAWSSYFKMKTEYDILVDYHYNNVQEIENK